MARIIVVGDWVVDEYWFLVRHESDISAHTGSEHYRSSNYQGNVFMDLCGAGHVARILYRRREEEGANYEIIGIGNWDTKDTPLLSHLLHRCEVALPSFRVTHCHCDDDPERVKLISLTSRRGTTHVVRQYHDTDTGKVQLSRIDWEKPPDPEGREVDLMPSKAELPMTEDDDIVVVHDLCKGVVTSGLIKRLARHNSNARWFVRSKDANPAWLAEIPRSVELLLIGPETAARQNPGGKWLRSGKITRAGCDVLESAVSPAVRAVVVVTDNCEVIARLGPGDLCVTGVSYAGLEAPARVGWSSAFFGALVYEMLDKEKQEIDKGAVPSAMQRVDTLCGEHFAKVPSYAPKRRTEAPVAVSEMRWNQVRTEWEQATTGLGIIDENADGARFELWRGQTDVEGYVACITAKREILREIGTRLRGFRVSGVPTRSLSIKLTADPGTGKTSLARSLASTYGFSFVSCDITQMVYREEVFDFFETIGTVQAKLETNVLVFVDEINAALEGEPVYSSFLAPLEANAYVRRGKTFSLRPAVWVFAGTPEKEDRERTRIDKESDFDSRMTVIHGLDLNSLAKRVGADREAELKDEARLEQVYLGAHMLRVFHPDVIRVSKAVLKYFWDRPPEESPARTIRKAASLARNVQFGLVTRDNWLGQDIEGEIPHTTDMQKTIQLK